MCSRNNFALQRYMDGLQAQQLSFLRILNAITTIDPQSPNWTIALRSRLTGNRRCWHSFRRVGCVTKWEGESSQQLFVFDVSHQIPERRSRSAIMHFACHLTRRFTSMSITLSAKEGHKSAWSYFGVRVSDQRWSGIHLRAPSSRDTDLFRFQRSGKTREISISAALGWGRIVISARTDKASKRKIMKHHFFASLFPKREAIVQGDPDVHIRVRCPSLPHDESKTLPSRIRFTAGLALDRPIPSFSLRPLAV